MANLEKRFREGVLKWSHTKIEGNVHKQQYLLTWTGQSLYHILLPSPKNTNSNFKSIRNKGSIKKVGIASRYKRIATKAAAKNLHS